MDQATVLPVQTLRNYLMVCSFLASGIMVVAIWGVQQLVSAGTLPCSGRQGMPTTMRPMPLLPRRSPADDCQRAPFGA